MKHAGLVDGKKDPRSTRMVERVRACAGQRHSGERGCRRACQLRGRAGGTAACADACGSSCTGQVLWFLATAAAALNAMIFFLERVEDDGGIADGAVKDAAPAVRVPEAVGATTDGAGVGVGPQKVTVYRLL